MMVLKKRNVNSGTLFIYKLMHPLNMLFFIFPKRWIYFHFSIIYIYIYRERDIHTDRRTDRQTDRERKRGTEREREIDIDGLVTN